MPALLPSAQAQKDHQVWREHATVVLVLSRVAQIAGMMMGTHGVGTVPCKSACLIDAILCEHPDMSALHGS